MGRNEVEPREGGVVAMDTGGHREEAVITAYEPGKRLATRTATAGDGRFMAFEYLIEGRDGGSTVLRVVHSGLLGDNWQDEYDALRRGWPFPAGSAGSGSARPRRAAARRRRPGRCSHSRDTAANI